MNEWVNWMNKYQRSLVAGAKQVREMTGNKGLFHGVVYRQELWALFWIEKTGFKFWKLILGIVEKKDCRVEVRKRKGIAVHVESGLGCVGLQHSPGWSAPSPETNSNISPSAFIFFYSTMNNWRRNSTCFKQVYQANRICLLTSPCLPICRWLTPSWGVSFYGCHTLLHRSFLITGLFLLAYKYLNRKP